MPHYVVNPGDTLSKIAQAHGIKDWHSIFEHPKNAALFQGRSADLIHPGETIFIPEVEPTQAPGLRRWSISHIGGIQIELRDPWQEARGAAWPERGLSEEEADFLTETWFAEGWNDTREVDTLRDICSALGGVAEPSTWQEETGALKRDFMRALRIGRVAMVRFEAPLPELGPGEETIAEQPPSSQPQRSTETLPPCDVQKLVLKATVLGDKPTTRTLTAPRKLRGAPPPKGVDPDIATLLRSYDLLIDTVAAAPSREEAKPEEQVIVEGRAEYHGSACPEDRHPLLSLQGLGDVEELSGHPGGMSWSALSSEPQAFYAQGVSWDFNPYGGDLGILFRFILQFFREDSVKLLKLEAQSCGRREPGGASPLHNLNGLVRIFRNDKWEIAFKLPPLGKYSHEKSRNWNVATGSTERQSKTTQTQGAGSRTETSTKTTTTKDGKTATETTQKQFSGDSASAMTTGTKESGAYVHGKQQGADGDGHEFRWSADGARPEGEGWSPEGDGYGRLLPEKIKRPNSYEISIKCNDRELECVKAVQTILETIEDFAKALKEALEALKRIPQMGWKVTVSLSVLEGSIKFGWTREMIEEAVDDRYLPSAIVYSLEIDLKIIDVKATLSFGFDADIGLGTSFVLKASGSLSCKVPLTVQVYNSRKPFEVRLKPTVTCEFKATAEASLFGWSLGSAEASVDGGFTVDGKFIVDPGRELRLTGKVKRNPIVFKGYFQPPAGLPRAFRKEVLPAADLASF